MLCPQPTCCSWRGFVPPPRGTREGDVKPTQRLKGKAKPSVTTNSLTTCAKAIARNKWNPVPCSCDSSEEMQRQHEEAEHSGWQCPRVKSACTTPYKAAPALSMYLQPSPPIAGSPLWENSPTCSPQATSSHCPSAQDQQDTVRHRFCSFA